MRSVARVMLGALVVLALAGAARRPGGGYPYVSFNRFELAGEVRAAPYCQIQVALYTDGSELTAVVCPGVVHSTHTTTPIKCRSETCNYGLACQDMVHTGALACDPGELEEVDGKAAIVTGWLRANEAGALTAHMLEAELQ